MNFKLLVESHIWNKENNSLIDYESNNYLRSNISINSEGYLLLNQHNLFLQEYKKSIMSPKQFLTSILKSKDNYILIFENEFCNKNIIKPFDDKVFLVMRYTYFKDNLIIKGLKLKEGDVLRFGKITLKVSAVFVKESHNKDCSNYAQVKTISDILNKENITSQYTEAVLKNYENRNNILTINSNAFKTTIIKNSINDVNIKKKRKKTGVLCRICMLEDNTTINPLINPCKCIGSMKYIHLACLKHWLLSKMVRTEINNIITHIFKSFNCEICKTPIPDKIRIKNEQYSLVEMERPQNISYLILETFPKERNETKHIYLIQFIDKQKIKLGRLKDSDFILSDISVSRNHAFIYIFEGCFYLKDNSSKFGTLYQLHNGITLLPNKPLALQIGKSFLSFKVEKTFSGMLNCCYRYPGNNIVDYNPLFSKQYPKEKIFFCDNASESDNAESSLENRKEEENKTLDRQDLDIIDHENKKEMIPTSNRVKEKVNENCFPEKEKRVQFHEDIETFTKKDLVMKNNFFNLLDNEMLDKNKYQIINIDEKNDNNFKNDSQNEILIMNHKNPLPINLQAPKLNVVNPRKVFISKYSLNCNKNKYELIKTKTMKQDTFENKIALMLENDEEI